VDFRFGNSIYYIFTLLSYNYSFHNFTSHKLETYLLCPVSLQVSYLKKNPQSTSFLSSVRVRVQTGSNRHRGHLLSYCACPGWLWGWRIIQWNENLQGKPKYSDETCPRATLSTTNPTWPDPGLNPGHRGGKPATNCLSCGATQNHSYLMTGSLLPVSSSWCWAPWDSRPEFFFSIEHLRS
jgi:hypothetical protein